MRLAIVGTGYVGLVTGAGFADYGNDVVCLDVDADKVARLARGELPIYEPGLGELVTRNRDAGRLRFTVSREEAVSRAEIIFLCVGTPSAADGSADTTALFQVAHDVVAAAQTDRPGANLLLVVKSTAPVGSADLLDTELRPRNPRGLVCVAVNPEFLAEGTAVRDFLEPDRIVLGVAPGSWAEPLLRRLYEPFRARIRVMSRASAELAKYASNAFLASRVSAINDIARYADVVGADVEDVARAVGDDHRIGPHFLRAGAGWGGSCFGKDLRALLTHAEQKRLRLQTLEATAGVNERHRHLLIDQAFWTLQHHPDPRTVALWGLAFKPGTDDIRDAPALTLVERMTERGITVRAYDPAAMTNVRAWARSRHIQRLTLLDSAAEALSGASALILMTEWREFLRPDWTRVAEVLRGKEAPIFDFRNAWDPGAVRMAGLRYVGVGRR